MYRPRMAQDAASGETVRNVAFTALLGPAVALAGVLAIELQTLFASDQEAVSAPTPLRIPSRPAVAALGVRREALAAILARPLFSPGRRPAAGPKAAAAPSAALPRLTGTIVQGSDRSVIFVPAGGGKPVVAHEGTEVGGYKVQAIQAGSVTISGPDGVHVLRPAFAPQPTAVGTPALPPGAAGPGLPNLQGLRGFAGLPTPPQAASAR